MPCPPKSRSQFVRFSRDVLPRIPDSASEACPQHFCDRPPGQPRVGWRSVPAASLVAPFPLWRAAVAAATLIVVAAAAAYTGWILATSRFARVTRLTIAVPPVQRLTRTGRHVLAISPDGRRIVYVANQQLYLREMEQSRRHPSAERTRIQPSRSFHLMDSGSSTGQRIS